MINKKLVFVGLACCFGLLACNNAPKVNNEESEVVTVQPADAITAVSDSIAMDSTNAALFVRRAQLYLAKEQIGPAMMDINQSLQLDPKNVDAYLLLADAYYGLGDENNITASLNKAIDINTYDARPYVKLAELNLLNQNYNLSNGYIDKALEISKFNPQAYFVRGMLYLTLQDTSAALKSFMISREQDEHFFDPLNQIAKIYAAQGNPLAESFMKDAVARFPEEYIARYELALYLQENGQPEAAMSHYDTLLAMEIPNSSRVLFNKGYVNLIYLDDYESALNFFNQALESDPNYIDALFNKGLTLEQMGNFKDAKTIFEEVLRKRPNYSLAIEAMNRLQN